MIKRRLVLDQGKMQHMGSGSVVEFAKAYDLDYWTIYNIAKRKGMSQRKGSKNQIVTDRLVELGVAKWVEYEEEEKAS